MTAISPETAVGQLVADRPSRSRVFGELDIDFCCGGKLALHEACRRKGLDVHRVVKALRESDLQADANPKIDPAAMSMTDLCDHIEATHHAYLRKELPRLGAMVRKVASVHGDNHPWMLEINTVFAGLADELQSHMLKEEQVLFPMIRAMEGEGSVTCGHCAVGLSAPISVMEHEHDSAGGALHRMRELSGNYTPPAGACNTFIATLDGLRQLESDMHIHVHKENSVLFPRALAAESAHTAAVARQ